jgi:N-acetylmuramoyl-L-alanine amidase
MSEYYVNTIPSRELKFRQGLKDAYGKVFKAKASNTYPGALRLVHPNDDWYYREETKKKRIVLHFTAGVLHGDIGELTRQHVSVAYVVARDGTIYELFDPKYWSYHLGLGAVGGNKTGSKSSIAIEISNFGPLTLDKEKGNLKIWSGKPYCSIDQAGAYVHSPEGFRGEHYFASFTNAQYKTLDSLLTNLCRKHNILRKLPKLDERERLFPKGSAPGEGIWSHQNYRSDKLDVGPAFLWERISGR